MTCKLVVFISAMVLDRIVFEVDAERIEVAVEESVVEFCVEI